jgi:hypothetical protein
MLPNPVDSKTTWLSFPSALKFRASSCVCLTSSFGRSHSHSTPQFGLCTSIPGRHSRNLKRTCRRIYQTQIPHCGGHRASPRCITHALQRRKHRKIVRRFVILHWSFVQFAVGCVEQGCESVGGTKGDREVVILNVTYGCTRADDACDKMF